MNLYPYFLEKALDSSHVDNVDLVNDDIRVLALSGYVYDATDKYVSDVLAGAGATEVARLAAGLTNKTVVGGTFDADDCTLQGLDAGEEIDDLILYRVGPTDDTDAVVIAHIDQDQGGTGLALPGNGSDVAVTWDAAGIFDL